MRRIAQLMEALSGNGHAVEIFTIRRAPRLSTAANLPVRRFFDRRACIAFLRERWENYDAVVFSTFDALAAAGTAAVRPRAWVWPNLDPAESRTMRTEGIAHRARGLIFDSPRDRELAIRLYGPGIAGKSIVMHPSIPPPSTVTDTAPLGFGAFGSRYLLYAGARDEVNGLGMLCSAFGRYRSARLDSRLRLVLCGPGEASFGDDRADIFDLGDVSAAARSFLIANALALLQPSRHDAGNQSVLEAWARRRPVGLSVLSPLADAEGASNARIVAGSKAEWESLIAAFDDADASAVAEMGLAGYTYYAINCTPENAARDFENALSMPRRPAGAPVYHNLAYDGDACNDAIRVAWSVGASLRGSGREVREHRSDEVFPAGPDDVAIAYCTPSTEYQPALETAVRRALYYCGAGVPRLGSPVYWHAPHVEVAFAEGNEEAALLTNAGARRVVVVQPQFALGCWDVVFDAALAAEFDDGKVNLLYAGSALPESNCEQLIAAFAYLLALDVDARLILAAPFEADTAYRMLLGDLIAIHRLEARIAFVDSRDLSSLAAAYRSARVFWSMSESAETRVPLFDAMWFDVPVLVLGTPWTRAFLGEAGVLFGEASFVRQAALAKVVAFEAAVRRQILDSQRRRRVTLAQGNREIERYIERNFESARTAAGA